MLHHVSLSVSPALVEECAAFWAALGFEPAPMPPALRPRARWLACAGTQVHLLLEQNPQPPRAGGHVAVVAGDYEAALAALARLGARVERRAEHWGSPRAYAYDPAGHRVEVMAWPPGESGASGESGVPGEPGAATPRPPGPA